MRSSRTLGIIVGILFPIFLAQCGVRTILHAASDVSRAPDTFAAPAKLFSMESGAAQGSFLNPWLIAGKLAVFEGIGSLGSYCSQVSRGIFRTLSRHPYQTVTAGVTLAGLAYKYVTSKTTIFGIIHPSNNSEKNQVQKSDQLRQHAQIFWETRLRAMRYQAIVREHQKVQAQLEAIKKGIYQAFRASYDIAINKDADAECRKTAFTSMKNAQASPWGLELNAEEAAEIKKYCEGALLFLQFDGIRINASEHTETRNKLQRLRVIHE